MSLVQQDWSKLEDTVNPFKMNEGLTNPLAFARLHALWYMTGNMGKGEPNYPVPALSDYPDIGELSCITTRSEY